MNGDQLVRIAFDSIGFLKLGRLSLLTSLARAAVVRQGKIRIHSRSGPHRARTHFAALCALSFNLRRIRTHMGAALTGLHSPSPTWNAGWSPRIKYTNFLETNHDLCRALVRGQLSRLSGFRLPCCDAQVICWLQRAVQVVCGVVVD